MFWSSHSPKVMRGLNLFEEASIFLSIEPRKDWGLSVFWSSQSPKVLRGLNFFVILKQKRCEAPKDSKDSIFWRSWETVPQIRKIEASQHFGTVGAAKH